ncbi:2-methylaconitate cis-trans isomerase PrpF [Alteromonas oceanisediminis]|uniref:2-methylaconitate cis-trans isomerase PrpF n=1 Tax=Alteromonas oceanisediminis TaxID=2836180 RepID=UPI001BDAC38A|nr:2-methylaconitate cis-trans isomerase PrpF [Alteromonas oceanisediminis]MBT0587095.1 2-methylaconitate cis-trans isomerase PrpF [Alteromonas oceanisediminis]
MRSQYPPQRKVPATYMRGGTSKGVFFNLNDLPLEAQQPGPARDQFLLRVIGSPDPYGKHTDGMGGATSSTSKAVILSKSDMADHDVNYLFGQVSIVSPFVDWSGNCGNLTAAVGAFAIENGLVSDPLLSNQESGIVTVRIWQENIQKSIVAHIQVTQGAVQETGDFVLDGVTFPAAEVVVEFIDPADGGGALFPTGNRVDRLITTDFGEIDATFINAGIPTIFVNASDIGYQGTELQSAVNDNPQALAKFERLRAEGAVAMGLIDSVEQAQQRQHTPKIAFVSPAKTYRSSSGADVLEQDIDVLVRALSMGKLHHAMMGTAAVAIGTAAAIPGTLVNLASGGGERQSVTFGHPSGTLKVGAEAQQVEGQWRVTKAIMSRSARVLMEGHVRVPMEGEATE